MNSDKLNDNSNPKYLYEGFPNSHGSHSLTDDEKELYNSIKEKNKQLFKNLEDVNENSDSVVDRMNDNAL